MADASPALRHPRARNSATFNTEGGNLYWHIGCAAITQLVEWLAVNQHVTGSSPVGGASIRARSLVR